MKREEIVKAFLKMKCGKAAGVDGNRAEFLKKGGDTVVDWFIRAFGVCMAQIDVPEDQWNAYIVPL